MTSYSTAEIADRVGIHRDTLLRWLRDGRIPEPARDSRGWRVFAESDLETLARLVASHDGIETRIPGSVRRGVPSLRGIEWDFTEAKTTYLTHSLHPYPAKFIPQIPNALIQELSPVGSTVADVFCGSGTTLVEGLLLKRNVVGVDANPLGCLITRAKTARLQRGDIAWLRQLAPRALELAERIAPTTQAMLFDEAPFVSDAWRPSSDSLAFWFDSFVVEELAEVLKWIGVAPTDDARDVALAAFSAVVVAVSRQDSDTRYVRREKGTSPGDTLRRLAKSFEEAVRACEAFTEAVETRFTRSVIHASVLDEPDIGQVDLVVSSPPYPNAYSYHLYHMTRMLWLGLDQQTFKRDEIGSHRKYSSKSSLAATPETFRSEMKTVMGWIVRHLRSGGYAAFVIGDSTIAGQRVNNAEILSEVAATEGLAEVDRIERRLHDGRKSFNPSIGRIKSEHILVLRRMTS